MPVLPPNIVPPVFSPVAQTIAGITNSIAPILTTDLPHGYRDLLIARLNIPKEFGMQQANQAQVTIIVLNPTQFVMFQIGPNGRTPFDTTYFDPFIVPADFNTPAQVIPMGEFATTFENTTKNILPL